MPFGDHALYVDPRDDKIALKLMAGRCWQRRELEAAIAALRAAGALRPNGIFIDVGANIGVQSIYALASGAFARAIAIEPEPHNFALLERNLRLNGLERRIEAVEAAASADAGHLQLVRHHKNHGAHSAEGGFGKHGMDILRVPAITLDGLLVRQGVAPEQVGLVKIDVEGHELAVLEGMDGLRRAGVPIIVELTVDRRDQQRLDRFKSLLAPCYSRVIDLSDAAGNSALPRPVAALTWRALQADLLVF